MATTGRRFTTFFSVWMSQSSPTAAAVWVGDSGVTQETKILSHPLFMMSPGAGRTVGEDEGRRYMNCSLIYTQLMTKRLIEIDDELLERARGIAGVDTITGTVRLALQQFVDQDTAVRHVARLRKPGAIDLDLVEAARSPETGAGE